MEERGSVTGAELRLIPEFGGGESEYLSPDTQVCAIIPGPTSHVSEAAYERFVTQMQALN